jgi:hypothetical protein
VVEVLGRDHELWDTLRVRNAGLRPDQDKVLRVKLLVGDYTTEIESRSVETEFSITAWTRGPFGREGDR